MRDLLLLPTMCDLLEASANTSGQGVSHTQALLLFTIMPICMPRACIPLLKQGNKVNRTCIINTDVVIRGYLKKLEHLFSKYIIITHYYSNYSLILDASNKTFKKKISEHSDLFSLNFSCHLHPTTLVLHPEVSVTVFLNVILFSDTCTLFLKYKFS